MQYSMRDIMSSLPKEKNLSDSYWTRFILRPLSYPISWLFLALNISPNMVSWLGVLIALLGGILFSLNFFLLKEIYLLYWIGIILFILFSIFDCVDGNIARTIKKSNPWGAWVDAVAGYIAYTIALLSLGLATGKMNPQFQGLFIFLGGFSAASNMLIRASVQSYKFLNAFINGFNNTSSPASEKKLSEHLGITGAMFPLFALGVWFHILPVILIFYTFVYGFGSLWLLFLLSKSISR